ncbi:hypothetical protein AB4455_06490 [Vibrio sp. 10N.261.46.E12]|uniref:hypothetical protein n=1 Tax=unclassified Vibrio TaxID=2614977 RepID=UPI0009777BE2|nr:MULTISPECIES: hypothetical protein [unclassified Vibrio]OMO37192.1 hypothetical protein BH584_23790 [Vibrio sp. 10N.261.45.E1]PMJ25775.1 hypothetical protein BCU27_09945 [Vibrio sp. 10N.286.45.B6]PML84430.1 hypothetical protein BCT66_17445 [Vibrio sp. 10N.261.49.E11]PMM90182.1 hypothetical protein BCT46_23740 [Vibrio sp. 10N.261.46.E8]PMN46145.1 hypothetical protein BCT32_11160 [Vibrio sp. 10N.261.45.E11]
MDKSKIIYPKKVSRKLQERALKALKQVETGTKRFRITKKSGLKTLDLGRFERLVKDPNGIVHVFQSYGDFNRFIDKHS